MEQKGCFIGFTFGNRHSSELGIFRTSVQGRYESNFAPPQTDITTDMQNIDGSHYWSSSFAQREIPISFAFYGMTEEQLVKIKQILNDKKIHSLILDEEPYKVWSAKLTGTTIMKNICFEKNGTRFYHGEGTLIFTTYYPFARSRYQYIEDYNLDNIPEWRNYGDLHKQDEKEVIQPAILQYDFEEDDDTGSLISFFPLFVEWLDNTDLLTDSDVDLSGVNSYIEILDRYSGKGNLDEWKEASKIPSRALYTGSFSDGIYDFYNAGDTKMPFKIYFSFIDHISEQYHIYIDGYDLSFLRPQRKGMDEYFVVDMSNGVIQGCDRNYNKTKNLYNHSITSGDFFYLPIGASSMRFTPCEKIEFNYLYL